MTLKFAKSARVAFSIVFFFFLTTLAQANLPYIPIQFQSDEAAHHTALYTSPRTVHPLSEWWYYNGELKTTDGKWFGYYVSIYYTRFSNGHGEDTLVPFVMFQLTDVNKQQVYGANVPFFDAQAANFSTKDLTVTLDADNSLQKVNGAYLLKTKIKTKDGQTVQLALKMTPTRALMPIRETGLIDMWWNTNSYYYSVTRLTTDGTIQINADKFTIDPQQSLSWYDHQWGDFLITPWNQWVWFGIQLTNGISINTGIIVDPQTKEPLPGTNTASIDMPDGTHIYDKNITVENYKLPAHGFPESYVVKIPALKMRLVVSNLAPGQDVNGLWEGISHVTGVYLEDTAVAGYAYAENTLRN